METNNEAETIPDPVEFMTALQAAEQLGIHVAAIPKMVRIGKLEGVQFESRWFISRKSVVRYMFTEED